SVTVLHREASDGMRLPLQHRMRGEFSFSASTVTHESQYMLRAAVKISVVFRRLRGSVVIKMSSFRRLAIRSGFPMTNSGPVGRLEAVTTVAQRAEALGYSSLWTVERVLYPVKLQSPYPGTPDGSLPEVYKHVLDPLDALAFVAGQTREIK